MEFVSKMISFITKGSKTTKNTASMGESKANQGTVVVPDSEASLAKSRKELKLVQRHHGGQLWTIDPKYGNDSCRMCGDLQDVANALGKDEGKCFRNLEAPTEYDMEMFAGWVDTDYFQKWCMCMGCARKDWAEDSVCECCGLLINHWGYDDFQVGECYHQCHPQCALRFYERKFGPCTGWIIDNDKQLLGNPGSGNDGSAEPVINECLCGHECDGEDITRALYLGLGQMSGYSTLDED